MSYKRGLSVVWKGRIAIGNRHNSDLYLKIDAFKKLTKSLKNSYNQWQKIWEKLLFRQFCISTPFPLLTVLRNNEQNLGLAMLWVLKTCIKMWQ